MAREVLGDQRPGAILLVEDLDADADLVRHLLKRYPYSLSRAKTYKEVRAFTDPVEVVLLDLRIPGAADPIRLVRDVVQMWPRAAVILLTGLDDEEVGVRAMSCGAQVRLLKATFDHRRLDLAIREAYARKRHSLDEIERSRANMVLDPGTLRDVVLNVVEDSVGGRIESVERAMLSKLRKLVPDTDVHPTIDLPPEPPEDEALAARAHKWMSGHGSLLRWAVTVVFLAMTYVTEFRDAVLETRGRVVDLESDLASIATKLKDCDARKP